MQPFRSSEVKQAFSEYPKDIRDKLMQIRELIFDVASKNDQIGELEETLKWGEPSYIPTETKSGTTIRIHHKQKMGDNYGVFVHCQTSIIEELRREFEDHLQFDGNRGIIFARDESINPKVLKRFITGALTYHLD